MTTLQENGHLPDRLHQVAYTLREVTLVERRRVMEEGIEEVWTLRGRLKTHGVVIEMPSAFMRDMPTLAVEAGEEGSSELLVSAGMLMLAGEIERLEGLISTMPPREEKAT